MPSKSDPKSQSSQKKWIVKDGEGKIFGPFNTEQVLQQIDRGYFIGGEQIASYPGGRWIAISKAPEFYDRLLDVLAAEAKQGKLTPPATQAQPANTSEGKDEVTQKASDFDDSEVTDPLTEVGKPRANQRMVLENPSVLPPQAKPITQASNLLPPPAIELTDLKSFEPIQKSRGSKLPLILIFIALVLAAAAVFLPDEPIKVDGKRIHLLSPRHRQLASNSAEMKAKFTRAIGAFQMDTFSGYQRAQGDLVELIESAPQKPEFTQLRAEWLAALCLTYRELWPYAYQDSVDMKAVTTALQEAKGADPGGKFGATCEVVHLLLSGRARDAQTLTESMLVEDAQAPSFFEMRGELFYEVGDFTNAATYFRQARTLWPQWMKGAVQEARAVREKKLFPQAIAIYREVLAAVPTHAVARVELGLIEGVDLNHLDDGMNLIKPAIEGKERLPQLTESRGLFGMAYIFERQNQKKKALEYAKRAYAGDATNRDAKAMILRIGGQGDLPTKSAGGKEREYLGDQYVRAGDCYAAQAEFKAAFEAEPKNGTAAMKAGKCLWELNQSNDAIEWMKKAVVADSNLTAAYTQLADYYAQRYDYSAAMQVLQKIQRLQPQSYEVYRGYAAVELRRNNNQGAINFAMRALKIYDTDLETVLIMCKANLGLRNFQEAQKFAGRAVELDYSNVEAQVLYGKSEAGLRGVDSGAQYMQKLINKIVITQGQQVPQAAIEYRVALGDINMQDDRFKQAEDSYRQAISLDKDNKKALIGLAHSLQMQSMLSQALEMYLRAAILDPSDADPIYRSGLLYLDVGKLADSLRQFERVLKINPKYPLAHTGLARVYLRQGDAKKALEEALKERENNPELGDSYLVAAEAYFSLKQYSNCSAEYQQASKRIRTADVLVRMARCYRLTGALDSAQSLLRQAQSIESGNPDLYKEQGAIFHMKGMADEAITAYNQYLRLVPAASDKAEIEARIRRVQSGDLNVGE